MFTSVTDFAAVSRPIRSRHSLWQSRCSSGTPAPGLWRRRTRNSCSTRAWPGCFGLLLAVAAQTSVGPAFRPGAPEESARPSDVFPASSRCGRWSRFWLVCTFAIRSAPSTVRKPDRAVGRHRTLGHGRCPCCRPFAGRRSADLMTSSPRTQVQATLSATESSGSRPEVSGPAGCRSDKVRIDSTRGAAWLVTGRSL